MLRRESAGQVSLDDLMRRLWQRWQSEEAGLQEREPERLAAELAGSDLTAFFDLALYSTEELPVEEALRDVGIALTWRARRDARDTGGVADDEADAEQPAGPDFGALVADQHGQCRIRQVASCGAAESAGLAPGDLLLALNHVMVEPATVFTVLQRHATLTSIPVHYARHGQLRSAELPLVNAAPDTARLSIVDQGRADAWMGTDA